MSTQYSITFQPCVWVGNGPNAIPLTEQETECKYLTGELGDSNSMKAKTRETRDFAGSL